MAGKLDKGLIKLLTRFLVWLLARKTKPKPKLALPTSTERIDYGDLYALLRSKAPKAELFLSDNSYLLCRKSDIVSFLVRDKTNRQEYVAEKYDCDDFAYRLMGQITVPGWSDLAFGLVWTDRHALNGYVGEDSELYFVEPQADVIQSDLLSWQGDHIRLIMM